MINPNFQSMGTVGGQPIIANVTFAFPVKDTGLKTVVLSQDYARSPPPNYPVPNPGMAVPSLYNFAQTIPAETSLNLYYHEAAALVAAGAASFV